jgi:hypothetical protein
MGSLTYIKFWLFLIGIKKKFEMGKNEPKESLQDLSDLIKELDKDDYCPCSI